MEQYEINIIKVAFKRCFGLQENCKYFDSPNKAFKQTAFETLAQMTGLRVEFIKEHKEEIQKL